jgi:hypothetical protein
MQRRRHFSRVFAIFAAFAFELYRRESRDSRVCSCDSREMAAGNKTLFSKWTCRCRSASKRASSAKQTAYVVHPSAGAV